MNFLLASVLDFLIEEVADPVDDVGFAYVSPAAGDVVVLAPAHTAILEILGLPA